GVAPKLIGLGAADWARLAFPIRRLAGLRLNFGAAGGVLACPFVGGLVARSRRATDQGARDFAESVALAAGELHALWGSAEQRLAGQRLERARADRDDVGRHDGRRRMAQNINLGGALRLRR